MEGRLLPQLNADEMPAFSISGISEPVTSHVLAGEKNYSDFNALHAGRHNDEAALRV
jgi:hypothetical protein